MKTFSLASRVALSLSLLAAACGTPTATDAGDAMVEAAADARTTDVPVDRATVDAFDVPGDPPADSPPDATTPDEGAPDVTDVVADAGCSQTMCGTACADLATDPRHCGACDNDCTVLPGVDAARAQCVAGVCDLSVSCAAGRAHCSANASDGCEADVTVPSSCGACGTVCAEPTPACTMGAGGTYGCASGCAAPMSTRCSAMCVDTMGDPNACGSCTNVCPRTMYGTPTCTGGVCGIACAGGTHYCGSECRTDDDATACGSACVTCPSVPNGSPACIANACSSTCNAGFHRCGTACVAADDPTACGTGCTVCTAPANASPTCGSGACGFVCNPGFIRNGAACAPIARQIAPTSTANVTSRRPVFRWTLPAGADGAHVDLCRDRACTMIVAALDVLGTSTQPAADLPIGMLFWRVAARAGSTMVTGFGPTWQVTIGSRNAPLSTSWGSVLDVNGDGFADIAVGAPHNTAHVYLYLGSATGVPTTASITLSPADADAVEFGRTIASAGDVNGDGFADLVVGSRDAAFTPGPGRAYVYFGSATGVAAAPSITLSGVDGVRGNFGNALASAGDVNGDGYGDLLVGADQAPFTFTAGAGSGRAYLYLGGPAGPSIVPSRTFSQSTLAAMSGYGLGIAGAGDVNGDGFADVVISAPYANASSGVAYVYLGSATGASATPASTLSPPLGAQMYFGIVAGAGDLNGDGFTEIAVGATGGTFGSGATFVYNGSASGVAAPASVVLTGPDGGGFGSSIAGAGDVDGDGFGDLVVGAHGARMPSTSMFPGRAYVFRGGASGPANSYSTALTGPGGDGTEFGISIAAGDVNADGDPDLFVGAYQAGASLAGRAYGYYGSVAGVATGASPSVTLAPPANSNVWFGISLAL